MLDFSLAKLIQSSIDLTLAKVNTCVVGSVVSYDKAKCAINAKINLKKKYADGTVIEYPQLINVPVVFPRCGNAFIKLPIKANDSVILFFSQRSIDKWKSNGGVIDPGDTRKFNISDAIAFPGCYAFNDVSDFNSLDDNNLYVVNSNIKIVMNPSGKIAIGISGTELLSQVSDGLGYLSDTETAIQAITVPTVTGPSGNPINSATFANIKTNVDTTKSKVDSIKGTL